MFKLSIALVFNIKYISFMVHMRFFSFNMGKVFFFLKYLH